MIKHSPSIVAAMLIAVAVLDASAQQGASSAASTGASASEEPTSAAPDPGDEDVTPHTLDTVIIKATEIDDASPGSQQIGGQALTDNAAANSDSARLLEDIPGVSVYGAGGISSLPTIHGLADDRLRIQVDGADLATACPNHMNSTLSYIHPTNVGSATVFSAIAPVSAGGDSIGGTIQLESLPPEFATRKDGILMKGRAGYFFRSNGHASGYDFGARLASEHLHLSYSESSSESRNYKAARDFKAPGAAAPGRGWLDGDVIGSSEYDASTNRDVGMAMLLGNHLVQLNVGRQTVGFEGFPNQRMDMTDNDNTLMNLRYTGQYSWGELEARVYDQDTRHEMDMGPDRFSYGFGMPMKTEATTRGTLVKTSIELSEQNVVRLGSEYQTYDLDDWWLPVGSGGAMAPNKYWNIRDGERDRIGVFGEWESRWTPEWLTVLGVRTDIVRSDAGPVQGYNDSMGIWTADARAFNARDHRRTDHHIDLSALARYAPGEMWTFEGGYARKTRSPNLYERYAWSTNAMAALMNNFVGDGNGYIGNPGLRPEVADTLSASGDWHDAGGETWGVRVTGHYTFVWDCVDARRCNFGQCGVANVTRKNGFVLLQYANQSARLYGIDVSGHWLLGRSADYGSVTASGRLSHLRGRNETTGDGLYHIVPLDSKIALTHQLGGWTTTAEAQWVGAKTRVSDVRNEIPTKSYSLFNLRSSYEWKYARIDLSVENVLNNFYRPPLGGAYLGQGLSMSTNTIPWGIAVPGPGRSINAAVSVFF